MGSGRETLIDDYSQDEVPGFGQTRSEVWTSGLLANIDIDLLKDLLPSYYPQELPRTSLPFAEYSRESSSSMLNDHIAELMETLIDPRNEVVNRIALDNHYSRLQLAEAPTHLRSLSFEEAKAHLHNSIEYVSENDMYRIVAGYYMDNQIFPGREVWFRVTYSGEVEHLLVTEYFAIPNETEGYNILSRTIYRNHANQEIVEDKLYLDPLREENLTDHPFKTASKLKGANYLSAYSVDGVLERYEYSYIKPPEDGFNISPIQDTVEYSIFLDKQRRQIHTSVPHKRDPNVEITLHFNQYFPNPKARRPQTDVYIVPQNTQNLTQEYAASRMSFYSQSIDSDLPELVVNDLLKDRDSENVDLFLYQNPISIDGSNKDLNPDSVFIRYRPEIGQPMRTFKLNFDLEIQSTKSAEDFSYDGKVYRIRSFRDQNNPGIAVTFVENKKHGQMTVVGWEEISKD